jgi:hypothetical protein
MFALLGQRQLVRGDRNETGQVAPLLPELSTKAIDPTVASYDGTRNALAAHVGVRLAAREDLPVAAAKLGELKSV